MVFFSPKHLPLSAFTRWTQKMWQNLKFFPFGSLPLFNLDGQLIKYLCKFDFIKTSHYTIKNLTGFGRKFFWHFLVKISLKKAQEVSMRKFCRSPSVALSTYFCHAMTLILYIISMTQIKGSTTSPAFCHLTFILQTLLPIFSDISMQSVSATNPSSDLRVICITTHAVYVRVLSGLEADDFIAAFHRFSARRGSLAKVFRSRPTSVKTQKILKVWTPIWPTLSEPCQSCKQVF